MCVTASAGGKEKTVSHYARCVLPFFRVKALLFTWCANCIEVNGAEKLAVRKQCLNENGDELEDAVSYRKPMEVKEVVCFPHEDGLYARCPRCRITMEREYVRYCDRCGQCLDWESYDDALILLNTGVKCD